MEKSILIQYADLREEVKEIRRSVQDKKDRIQKMFDDKEQVSDSVKGTRPDGTYGNIMITGFPETLYRRRTEALRKQIEVLENRETELLEYQTRVEEFIDEIEDSRIRRIFRYYFVDNMSWIQVAYRMGGNHTAESCRKASERFLEKN